jgi:hypothetical protein
MDYLLTRGTGLWRSVSSGAALGIATLVFGSVWSSLGEHTSINLRELLTQGLIGGVAGAVISFVLFFTRSFRARGLVYHYGAWIFACLVAAFVLVLPSSLTDIWHGLAFAIWLGVAGGLGLGVTERQLTAGDRTGKR